MPRNNTFNAALKAAGLDKQYRAELEALKKEGMSAQKATLQVQKKYKALVGNGATPEERLMAPAGAVLSRLRGIRAAASVGDDADWVYETLGFSLLGKEAEPDVNARMAEAPSAGAVGLLLIYKERPRDFYDAYLQRRLPHRTEVDRQDQAQRSGRSIEELCEVLLGVFKKGG